MLDRVRSWDVTATPFRSLDELLRLAGFKVAHSAATDEVLRRLVVVAAVEPLAARIVLQRLLPGLLAIVRREQQRDRDVDAFDLLAAEAWLAIVTYRADLRPTDVAAKLLNDARHRAFTTPRRKQERSREDVVPPATSRPTTAAATRFVVRGADDRAARGAPGWSRRRRPGRRA